MQRWEPKAVQRDRYEVRVKGKQRDPSAPFQIFGIQ